MKTISKEFAKKIDNTVNGVYDTNRYRYITLGSSYYRASQNVIGTPDALGWENWERLEVRA